MCMHIRPILCLKAELGFIRAMEARQARGQQVHYETEAPELLPHHNPAYEIHSPGIPPVGQTHHYASSGGRAVEPDSGNAVTIGEALEKVAEKAPKAALEEQDVRAIQSAEARATGVSQGVAAGPGAHAQSLLTRGVAGAGHTTGSTNVTYLDALHEAKSRLPRDKVVTELELDAAKVQEAELRNSVGGALKPQGVGTTLQEAADQNKERGFI